MACCAPPQASSETMGAATRTTTLRNGVRQILNKNLPQLSENQEVVMITVEYAPGESTPPHRHNAHTYVYVLEGTIGMQLEGGEAQTLMPGDTFYELPDDIHLVSRNMSDTQPAKFLVFFIKTRGMPFIEMLEIN